MHALVLSCFSCVQLFATLWTVAIQAPLSMGLSNKNTGVGCRALLQGSLGDSTSNSSEKLLQRGRVENSIHVILVKREYMQKSSTYFSRKSLLV